MRERLRVVWNFFIHCLVGTLVFLVVASFAVGLSLISHLGPILLDLLIRYPDLTALIREIRLPRIIAYGLDLLEIFIFAVDFLLFVRFLYKTAVETWKAL